MLSNLITMAHLIKPEALNWCMNTEAAEVLETLAEDGKKHVLIDNGSPILAIAPIGEAFIGARAPRVSSKKINSFNIDRLAMYTALQLNSLGIHCDVLLCDSPQYVRKEYNWMFQLQGNGALAEACATSDDIKQELELVGFETCDITHEPRVFAENDCELFRVNIGTYPGGFCRTLELLTQINRLKLFASIHKETELLCDTLPSEAMQSLYDGDSVYECAYCTLKLSGSYIMHHGHCPTCYTNDFNFAEKWL